MSLSAWRAWVEIFCVFAFCFRQAVALRMESVGRNYERFSFNSWFLMSLSAWRAWVEIFAALSVIVQALVALRMESVGRNHLYHYLTAL